MRLIANRQPKALLLATFALSMTCCGHTLAGSATNGPGKETIQAGRRLYDERCKTVAGEKIYRTVPDVEGIVLLKVRHQAPPGALNDRDWPGAAFAREFPDDSYIREFLGVERASRDGNTYKPIPIQPPRSRGYINVAPSGDPTDIERPGYRFVDVQDEQTGQWWRYSLIRKPRPSSKIGWIDTLLDRQPAPPNRSRYGVTFEDHVISEERALGLASSTIKVIDLKTQEVLGEATQYAWTPAVLFPGPKYGEAQDSWLSAYHCGNAHSWFGFETRLFVDQVLQPLNSNKK
jgi:hypothetical protein